MRTFPATYILPTLLLVFLAHISCTGQDNPLAEGSWAKFRIPATGMYRITYQELEAAGITPSSSEDIQVLGLPGGPLPQANYADFPQHLEPIPYRVFNAGGNSFGPGDFIVFFSEGPHTLRFESGEVTYNNNPYDEANYVFVSADGDTPGVRISDRDPIVTGGEEIRTFTELVYHEIALNNLLKSGRTWYGERFETVLSQTFEFDFPRAVPGGRITLLSKVMSQSFGPSAFQVSINNQQIGTQELGSVPDFLNPPSNNPNTFAVKGRERQDIFTSGAASSQLSVKYDFLPAAGVRSVGYLDYFVLTTESRLEHLGNQTVFSSEDITLPVSQTIVISTPVQELEIWDISDVLAPERIADNISSGGELRFNAQGKSQARYAVFAPGELPVPEYDETRTYDDILAGSPDLLIVTHENFRTQASRLAEFRRINDGLDVMVVTTDEAYDLMASGRKDLTAIRNLVRHFYYTTGLRYLLLFGKGSYDYLNTLPFFSNYVPVYQSRNSLNPLYTYASDDYFGFMDPLEGDWLEISGGNHTLDIGVGRLPVTTEEEARAIVDKLIRYRRGEDTRGSWRSRLLFVADDGDFNLHHGQSDQLASKIDTTEQLYRSKRLFLGTFPQISNGGGEISPKASEALNTEIRKGALIVNYTGHGNETSWTQEQILRNSMIPSWRNIDRLPLFVTATCEFGRFDDPSRISGGEILLTEPGGGGIGILTTGRPVFANSNFMLNEAFYNAVFRRFGGVYGRLGDVMRLTKNNSVDLATDPNKVGNRNFSLLGDPSLRLAFPGDGVVLTGLEVNGQPADTLHSGDRVTLRGAVISGIAYEGEAEILVLDKPAPVETLSSPKYIYEERINTIFQGTATIRNNLFTAEFIVPVNISNKSGFGRIHMYALDETTARDALGGSAELLLSSAASIPAQDQEGPEIGVFFGDSTNRSRQDIPANTLLYVRLTDESGINTSGFGVGNNLTAVLDDSATFILNEYYKALKDTYKTGWAVIPLNNLKPGDHLVTITARDVFNNSSQVTVHFEVADPGTLVVNSLRNYPNPVIENTTVRIGHNRPGDNLDIRLIVMDTRGTIVSESLYYVENSAASVTLPVLEAFPQSENLAGGIYIYGVEVRSRQDGAVGQRYEKMMVLREK